MENIIISDVAWPRPADAYDACMQNVKELHKLGVIHIHDAVDAFCLDVPLSRLHLDKHRIGLVLWSGVHPRRHDGQHEEMQELYRRLRWSHRDFLETALDAVSSQLPDATVLACDKGDWCEGLKLNMDAKPIVCFETKYGEHASQRFFSEASGFDGRHVRPWDTNQFVAVSYVSKFLEPALLHREQVNVPDVIGEVLAAGLQVLFLGEYTCAQSTHCLKVLQSSNFCKSKRRLCNAPWYVASLPLRGWLRGDAHVFGLRHFRRDSRRRIQPSFPEHLHRHYRVLAAHNWSKVGKCRGKGMVSDFGQVFWPTNSVLRDPSSVSSSPLSRCLEDVSDDDAE